jgi:metal-dependent amidase/aminoacylase/carboxypeptidase family protein
MILALDDCACSRNDEKSWLLIAADYLAAILQDGRGGVALQRLAECVVGGDEEPCVAAGLGDRSAGSVGQHPGIVGPVNRVR